MQRRGNADPAAVGKSLLPPPVGAATSRRIGAVGVVPSDGEEEDSWSEPDVTAARRRMGLTAGGIAAERKRASGVAADQLDSSETDLEKREFAAQLFFLRFWRKMGWAAGASDGKLIRCCRGNELRIVCLT